VTPPVGDCSSGFFLLRFLYLSGDLQELIPLLMYLIQPFLAFPCIGWRYDTADLGPSDRGQAMFSELRLT
jgi:hypothetical protein